MEITSKEKIESTHKAFSCLANEFEPFDKLSEDFLTVIFELLLNKKLGDSECATIDFYE